MDAVRASFYGENYAICVRFYIFKYRSLSCRTAPGACPDPKERPSNLFLFDLCSTANIGYVTEDASMFSPEFRDR